MPTSEPSGFPPPGAPDPSAPDPAAPPPPSEPAPRPSIGGSRWIDYDTHELLEMISELEDERRWARLREGVLWAVIIHALFLIAVFLLPRYVWVPRVIQPQIAARDQRDWTYLDSPSVPAPRPPKLAKPPVIDRKTLEDLQKNSQPPAPVEQAKVEQPKLAQPAPPPPVIPPSPQSQSQIEAPQPKAVPARPNFAMGSQNPADQLQQAMRDASRNPGYGGPQAPQGGLAQHPGAGGGATIISDTQGVDFNSWLQRWYWDTEHTWDPLIPDEVNPPIYKQGQVQIRFRVAPNGRVIDGSMELEGRSGDTALDRAAWGAITGSSYPPLPREFHGPYIELRAVFMYNMRPQ
ncbi:MAG: cell envelope integrity protein TolA [Terracidiphilus sp.]